MNSVLPLDLEYASLHAEVHSRPAPPIETPTAEVWHWVIKDERQAPFWENVSLEDFHSSVNIPDGLLRWERHTEFLTATYVGVDKPTEQTLDKIRNLNGKLWTATRISIHPKGTPIDAIPYKRTSAKRRCGGICTPYEFEVLTDFVQRDDGCIHYQVRGDFKDGDARGRFVRRLVELETYRFVALLGLNEVRARLSTLDQLEVQYSEILHRIQGAQTSIGADAIHELTGLSLEIVKLQDHLRYRVGATKAYSQIVEQRLISLSERRLDQRETLGNFIAQRLRPAVNTVFAFEKRISELENSVRMALSLTRTIIDRDIQAQNQIILKNTEKRAAEQVKLMHAVEKFSSVAITYYLVSLLIYLFKPFDFTGKQMAITLAIPIIGAVIIYMVRKTVNAPEDADRTHL